MNRLRLVAAMRPTSRPHRVAGRITREEPLMSTPIGTSPARALTQPSACQVIAQARLSGPQDTSVMGAPAGATGTGRACISVRVGRVLLHIEDRQALVALTRAWRRALDLADGVFEPLDDAFTAVERLERRRFERSRSRH